MTSQHRVILLIHFLPSCFNMCWKINTFHVLAMIMNYLNLLRPLRPVFKQKKWTESASEHFPKWRNNCLICGRGMVTTWQLQFSTEWDFLVLICIVQEDKRKKRSSSLSHMLRSHTSHGKPTQHPAGCLSRSIMGLALLPRWAGHRLGEHLFLSCFLAFAFFFPILLWIKE